MPIPTGGNTLPQALTNIRCCTALKNCGKETVQNAHKVSSAKQLYVYDDNNLRYSNWSNKIADVPDITKCLTICNTKLTEIVFLPLDNRILSGKNIRKGRISDCLILTQDMMSFVELKTEATSQACFMDRVNDAIIQHRNTFFNVVKPRIEKVLNGFPNIGVEFYVVFNDGLMVTATFAELQDAQADFLLKCGYPLYVDNRKEYK